MMTIPGRRRLQCPPPQSVASLAQDTPLVAAGAGVQYPFRSLALFLHWLHPPLLASLSDWPKPDTHTLHL